MPFNPQKANWLLFFFIFKKSSLILVWFFPLLSYCHSPGSDSAADGSRRPQGRQFSAGNPLCTVLLAGWAPLRGCCSIRGRVAWAAPAV